MKSGWLKIEKKKNYFKNWFKSTKPGSVMRYSPIDMKCVD